MVGSHNGDPQLLGVTTASGVSLSLGFVGLNAPPFLSVTEDSLIVPVGFIFAICKIKALVTLVLKAWCSGGCFGGWISYVNQRAGNGGRPRMMSAAWPC